MPLSENVNLADIAHRTQSFSGADLKSLCREAAFAASKKLQNSKEILMEDFEAALDLVPPSITKEKNCFYSN